MEHGGMPLHNPYACMVVTSSPLLDIYFFALQMMQKLKTIKVKIKIKITN
jgi:hypothetical protein